MGYKYLGKKVKDIKEKGLDSVKEFYDIANAVMRDYKKKKISKRTARGRLLLLYRLSFKKNNKKISKLSSTQLKKIRSYIRKLMEELWWRCGDEENLPLNIFHYNDRISEWESGSWNNYIFRYWALYLSK